MDFKNPPSVSPSPQMDTTLELCQFCGYRHENKDFCPECGKAAAASVLSEEHSASICGAATSLRAAALALFLAFMIQLVVTAAGMALIRGSKQTAFFWVMSFAYAVPAAFLWLGAGRLHACRHLVQGSGWTKLLVAAVWATRASAILLLCGLMSALNPSWGSVRIAWLIGVFLIASAGFGADMWVLSYFATKQSRRSLSRAAVLVWAAGLAIGVELTIGVLASFSRGVLELRDTPWGALTVALRVAPSVLLIGGLISSVLALRGFTKEMSARRVSRPRARATP